MPLITIRKQTHVALPHPAYVIPGSEDDEGASRQAVTGDLALFMPDDEEGPVIGEDWFMDSHKEHLANIEE